MDGTILRKKKIILKMISFGSLKGKERRKGLLGSSIVWLGFRSLDSRNLST